MKPRRNMKQTLMLVLEQVESGLFTYDEMVRIIEAIIKAIKWDFSEPGSPCSDLTKALERACKEWNVR